MTATERLRAMLDERGVEWREPNNMARSHTTYWTAGFLRCSAVEFNDGMVSIASSLDNITPEQAIEATLGRGECERLQDENERLRSCLSDSAENAKQIMHEAHVQEAENAKLRELVRDMWEYIHIGTAQDGQSLHDRTRELGVEV